MHVLKQSSVLEYNNLVKKYCSSCSFTLKILYRPLKVYNKDFFCLYVDSFGVKYFFDTDADYILNTLEKYYKISMDLEGKNYCGLTINRNYEKEYAKISMPIYPPKPLKRFLHPTPKNLYYAPQKWIVPEYGQSNQYEKVPNNTQPLYEKDTKYIQAKVGSLLYYLQSVDPTILPASKEISASQAKPTIHKNLLLTCCSITPTHNLTKEIRYHASDMILPVKSEENYLSIPGACSCISGNHYLSNHPTNPNNPSDVNTRKPILTKFKTIWNAVGFTAETNT